MCARQESYNKCMRKYLLGAFLCLGAPLYAFTPQTGDLLFQVGPGSGFERAVQQSTAHVQNPPFTHVGIAERTQEGVLVWEAHPESGVRRVPLADFLAQAAAADGRPLVSVKRVKRKYRPAWHAVTERLRVLKGRAYDFLFLPDNDDYYCSELVQETFRDKDGAFLFPSSPMSFAGEGEEISPWWRAYFERRGANVPSGVPGTNPADMARSDKLKEVHRYF